MDKFVEPVSNFAATCSSGGGFFKFPTWYKYLPCENGDVVDFELRYIWLILAAVLEMLLLLAGILAVAYFIYGGFVIMTSQGNPERISSGRNVILHATIGLVIVVLSAGFVQLVAGAF